MICQNCKTFYVRPPCPTCGHDPTKRKPDDDTRERLTPSQIREREQEKRELESGNQVLLQKTGDSERLVKPSERFRKEREESVKGRTLQRTELQDSNERLVKPSERLKERIQEDENVPSFQKFDRTDDKKEIRSPITMAKTKREEPEEDIPSFRRFDQSNETPSVNNISSELSKPENQHKLKNDKEYRSKVKETLEEVMGLLEKLIDEE